MNLPRLLRHQSLLTLVVACSLATLTLFSASRSIDGLVLDGFFQLRGPRPDAGDIVIVALSEDFLEAYETTLGRLDRRFYARALQTLQQAGAAAIGLDIFFPDPTPEDAELASAVRASGAVLPHIPARTVRWGERPGSGAFSVHEHLRYNPLLSDVPRGVISLTEHARETTPVVRFADGTLPSFALAVVRAAGKTPVGGESERPRLIDYRGPAGSIPYVSFLDLYRQQLSFATFEGKIVLVGATLLGEQRDQIVTPFGAMPGVEVVANEVYTLLHGSLAAMPRAATAGLVLLTTLLWPTVARRRRGLSLTLLSSGAVVGLAVLFFLAGLYLPPTPLVVAFVAAYLLGNYQRLRALDADLLLRLTRLFDAANFSQAPAVSGATPAVPGQALRGFGPRGSHDDARAMIRSLLSALDGRGGLLLLPQQRIEVGEVAPALEQLARRVQNGARQLSEGRFPHHLAQALDLPGGVLAVSLPSPPPPHLVALIEESARVFSQSARYHDLRQRTTTLAETLWPFSARSSEAKIEAIAMITDLLQTERSWLGVLLEHLPQALFISGPYGYRIYQNPAARRLLGEERDLLHAIPQALKLDAGEFRRDFVSAVEFDRPFELATTSVRGERPLMLSLHPVHQDGRVRAVAGVISDVSRIEELHRSRQEMLAAIAHDLRTPLTSVLGFADILLHELKQNPEREYAQLILSEAQRMKRITDDFLDVSRLEEGALELRARPSDLAEIVRYAVAAISPLAAKKLITISLAAPSALTLNVDPDLISRVLINLLTNAVKYSPERRRVHVALSRQGEGVRLEVIDQGYGIAAEDLSVIFERFGRAKRGPQSRIRGTGLGLYLAKRIVEAHGGTLTVESEPERGSAFCVQLPAREA